MDVKNRRNLEQKLFFFGSDDGLNRIEIPSQTAFFLNNEMPLK